ncbi:MAG TPA: type II CAAX endopeptidase family protein [Polyangiaceae bacterium]|nr:type II CAAX endopeptidase family protein [Polyangiaceae bacterium]
MLRWGAAAYAVLGILALVLADVLRGGSAFVHPDPWLSLEPAARHVYSVLWGLAFGGLVVVGTRSAVVRFAWARGLHSALRPFARTMSGGAMLVMAALSAFGEETLFRGLLEPWMGIVPQALLFGAVHQIPGPSRWVWVAWASAVGLALGCIFRLTGSLLGPLTAHALINALNLAFLKAYDPSPRRALGGLLGGGAPEPKPKPSH